MLDSFPPHYKPPPGRSQLDSILGSKYLHPLFSAYSREPAQGPTSRRGAVPKQKDVETPRLFV
jgi:hypothetical protein